MRYALRFHAPRLVGAGALLGGCAFALGFPVRHVLALSPNRTGAFFVRGRQDPAAAGSPFRKEVMPSSQYVVFVRPVTVDSDRSPRIGGRSKRCALIQVTSLRWSSQSPARWSFMVVISRLFSWYRLRALRLCLLTGTRPQRAALWVALAPVVREFLPLLDKAGQQVRAIVLVPTLSGQRRRAVSCRGRAAQRVQLVHRQTGSPAGWNSSTARRGRGRSGRGPAVPLSPCRGSHRRTADGTRGKYGCRRSQRDAEKACRPKWAGHPAASRGTKRSRGDHCSVQSKSPRPSQQPELVKP